MQKNINFTISIVLVLLLSSFNAFAYSYLSVGGSFLYIQDKKNETIKTIMEAKERGIGGYFALGSIANHNAGYEVELGFLEIDKTQDLKKKYTFSISAPYAFLNYLAIFGRDSPIKPYIGGGVGLMGLRVGNELQITIDPNIDTINTMTDGIDSMTINTESMADATESMKKNIKEMKETVSDVVNSADTDIDNQKSIKKSKNTSGLKQNLKEFFDQKKYRNKLAYQGIIGVSLSTTDNSMINVDYRYRALKNPISFEEKSEKLEYNQKTHGINVGLKIIF